MSNGRTTRAAIGASWWKPTSPRLRLLFQMHGRQFSVHARQLLSCILLLSTVMLFPGDSRARDPEPNNWPLTSIGRVNVVLGAGRFTQCTGTLIGPKHMLTAAHCLYDKIGRTWVRPSAVHFLAGYSRGDFNGHSQALSYEKGTQSAADGRGETAAPADWAIVELVHSLDLKPIKVQLYSTSSGIAHSILAGYWILAGYRNDRSHLLTVHTDCTVEAQTSSGLLLIYGCDAAPGESGSAIIEIRSGTEPEIIGILVASSQAEAPHALGVPSSTFTSGALRALGQQLDPPSIKARTRRSAQQAR